ncbi:uncharacterized protein LOC131854623 [Achroia grisella]|uniref:uncharacterized protein LOC131854623 n=1 Tax=Achroia grisella TaxID=688607 RepID=UPI0027D2AD5E|nr:uncharacterized protein LOC131854623 [Achroia grisella]
MTVSTENRCDEFLGNISRGPFSQAFMGYIMQCNQEFQVPVAKLAQMKTDDLGDIDPCLFACVFRRTGMLDDTGMYKAEINDDLKKALKSEENLNKLTAITKECTSVNEHSVTDGNKGCERAVMVLYCFHE